MMKSAQDLLADNAPGRLGDAWYGCISVRSCFVSR